MQAYPQDSLGRRLSPDGAWAWDGVQWAPAGRTSWTQAYAAPRLFADLAVTFLMMLVALNVLDIINSALDLYLFRGNLPAALEGTHQLWTMNRNILVAFSWLLFAFPGSAITVSMWVHRTYRNLAALGERPATSPAMAVAWFYIPVANLWKPYQVVREVWASTLHRPPGALLPAWWACWLAGIVAGNVQFQVSVHEPSTLSSRTLPLLLSFPSDLLWIASALLLARIILSVSGAQEERHSESSAA